MSTSPTIVDEVEIRATRRVSESFVRIELGGDCLAELGVAGGAWLDQRFKLIFPCAAGTLPKLPSDMSWYDAWLAVPEDERGSMRTYTVRDVVGEGTETRLIIDIVVHEPHGDDSGPGNDWARAATIGDRVLVVAPRGGHTWGGIEWAPPAEASELLIVGDETAAPAVYGILRDLPRDARGAVYLEVPVSDDVLDDVVGPAGVDVHWLPRDGAPRGEELRARVLAHLDRPATTPVAPSEVEIVEGADVWETPEYSGSGEDVSGQAPADGPYVGLYAWIAGESKVVTGLRRALVKDLGVDRHQVAFMGYWREGVAMKA